jgi:hypothetical protein
MTTTDLWSRYRDYTRDVTEHSRKLAFGGLAVCWLFRDPKGHFPVLVLWALGLITLYFAFDLLHPLVGGFVVRGFVQGQEARLWREKRTIEGDVNVPSWLDLPATILYVAKVLLLLTGFGALAWHIAVTAVLD